MFYENVNTGSARSVIINVYLPLTIHNMINIFDLYIKFYINFTLHSSDFKSYVHHPVFNRPTPQVREN